MQTAQEMNWGLEIAKIAVPSFVALVVPFIASYWLSGKLENYKKDINKELESYKVQLQAEFQTRFYTFQTKFSLWHQRQEQAMVEAFDKLTDFVKLVENLETYHIQLETDSFEHADIFIEDWHEKQYPKHLRELKDFYSKNRIFIDKTAQKQITNIISQVEEIINHKPYQNNIIKRIRKKLDSEILPSMKQFEDRFELLFSAENANEQLIKK